MSLEIRSQRPVSLLVWKDETNAQQQSWDPPAFRTASEAKTYASEIATSLAVGLGGAVGDAGLALGTSIDLGVSLGSVISAKRGDDA